MDRPHDTFWRRHNSLDSCYKAFLVWQTYPEHPKEPRSTQMTIYKPGLRLVLCSKFRKLLLRNRPDPVRIDKTPIHMLSKLNLWRGNGFENLFNKKKADKGHVKNTFVRVKAVLAFKLAFFKVGKMV